MKICLLVLLAGVCALAYEYPPGSGGFYGQYFGQGKTPVADKQFLHRQKAIFRLYKYINQPYYYYKEWYDISKDYSIENNLSYYTNQTAVKYFVHQYRQGFLPKGEIFSVFYNYQLQQAISVFNVFYYAQDFDTFYKTAVYLRGKINEGIFLYALSVAIIHRSDTYGFVIPPIYEVYPYYFFNSEVIQQAYQYKQQSFGSQQHGSDYTIYANYTGWYANADPEQYLSYFTEDVGINSYYYYYNLYYPFWLSGEQYGLKYDYRGELFYYTYQQLLARYYLERLSNGYGQISFVDYKQAYPTGYYSSLTYPNGYAFPSRPAYARLSDYFYNYGQKFSFGNEYSFSYSYVNDYERRIAEAIDSGFVYTRTGEKIDIYADPESGFNILGNLIEGNADSVNPRYYGSVSVFARHLFGYSYQPYNSYQIAPSALEHFETSLRDPAFYSFYKRIVYFFQTYKSYLPSYSYTDLYYPGVKVQSVEFDRLVTYFDYFDSDITNALYVSQSEYDKTYDSSYYHVYARQQRLNYKPFGYKITVTAEQAAESVVRVYIGPKYDEFGRPYSINENRVNFVLFDFFKYSLQAGSNIVERSSHQNYWYAPDRTTFQHFYDKVNAAIKGDEEFVLDGSEAYYGFPHRYLLPKGKYEGFPYQFYVIVSPYHPYTNVQHPDQYEYYYPKVGTGTLYYDTYALGYPFDRVIDEYSFYVPNSYFYDTKIYHRESEDVNSSYKAGEHYSPYPSKSYPSQSYPSQSYASQYPAGYQQYPSTYQHYPTEYAH